MFGKLFKKSSSISDNSIITYCDMLENDPNLLSMLVKDYMTIITNIFKSGEKCPFSKESLFIASFLRALYMGIYTIEYKTMPHDIKKEDEINIMNKILSKQILIDKVYDSYSLICEGMNNSFNNLDNDNLSMLFSLKKYDKEKFFNFISNFKN